MSNVAKSLLLSTAFVLCLFYWSEFQSEVTLNCVY